MALDELTLGPNRPARRWPVVLGVAALALLGVGAVADDTLRDREVAALVAAVERGEASLEHADRRVAAMVTYASPSLWSASTADGVRRDLEAIVQGAAADGAASVQSVRQQVHGTRVLPWHDDVERARLAVLEHLDARIDRLDAVAADARALFDPDPGAREEQERVRAQLEALR